MKWFISTFVLLLMLTVYQPTVEAADWASQYHDDQDNNLSGFQPELPFTLIGSFPSQYTTPVIANNILVTAESTGTTRQIVAYQLPNLERRWSFSIGTSFPRQILIKNNTVYFGLSTKPEVYALNLLDGTKYWQTRITGETIIRFAPIRNDDSIFVAGTKLHRLTPEGQYVWTKNYDVDSPLALDKSGLYFRIQGWHLVKIDPLTGQELWSYLTNTTFGTAPVLTGDALYAGTYQALVSLDKQTGQLRWKRETTATAPLIGNLAWASNQLIYSTNFGDITALSPEGQLKWTNRFNTNSNQGNGWNASFLVAGQAILARASSTEQIMLDVRNGQQLWRGHLLIQAASFQAITDGHIVMSYDDKAYIFTASQWTNIAIPPTSPPLASPSPIPPDPVVIIPGILESWPVNGQWRLDPVLGIFNDLIASLHEAGYQDGVTLFRFPYDWHQSNSQTAQQLRQLLTTIRQQTNYPKVDIIAHSMGGLVARSYIQGTNYANDVDQLITLGTPHHGSVKAYLTWEAGETGSDSIDQLKEQFLKYEAVKKGFGSNVVQYIQTKIPSIRELLPVFSYLKQNNQLIPYSPCQETALPCNPFLESLLATEINLKERVRTLTILSRNANSTYQAIDIGPTTHGLGNWQHGMPLDYPAKTGLLMGEGDGTVLTQSGRLDGVEELVVNGNHTSMVASAARTIVHRLSGKDVGVRVWQAPNRLVFVRLYSPANLLLTDSQGRQSGTDPENGQTLNEIPAVFYSGNSQEEEYFILTNPPETTYQLQVTGTNAGTFQVITSTITDETTTDSTQAGSIESDQSLHYQLTVGSKDTALKPISQPTNQEGPVLSLGVEPSPSSTVQLTSSAEATPSLQSTQSKQPETAPIATPIKPVSTPSASSDFKSTVPNPSSSPAPHPTKSQVKAETIDRTAFPKSVIFQLFVILGISLLIISFARLNHRQ